MLLEMRLAGANVAVDFPLSLSNQTAPSQKANESITTPLLSGPGPDMISFSFVLSRGLLNLSLKLAGLILELLHVPGMQVALMGAFCTLMPLLGWVFGLWVQSSLYYSDLKSLAGIRIPEALEKTQCLNQFWRLCADSPCAKIPQLTFADSAGFLS